MSSRWQPKACDHKNCLRVAETKVQTGSYWFHYCAEHTPRVDPIQELLDKWEADIKRYEDAIKIGAFGDWNTRITNTMGHISDLKRLRSLQVE